MENSGNDAFTSTNATGEENTIASFSPLTDPTLAVAPSRMTGIQTQAFGITARTEEPSASKISSTASRLGRPREDGDDSFGLAKEDPLMCHAAVWPPDLVS